LLLANLTRAQATSVVSSRDQRLLSYLEKQWSPVAAKTPVVSLLYRGIPDADDVLWDEIRYVW